MWTFTSLLLLLLLHLWNFTLKLVPCGIRCLGKDSWNPKRLSKNIIVSLESALLDASARGKAFCIREAALSMPNEPKVEPEPCGAADSNISATVNQHPPGHHPLDARYFTVVDGAKWTNNHQCISWPFCPLDGLHIFIWHWMGFIIIHFFLLLLLTIILFFFLVFGRFSLSLDLTHGYHAHFPTLISIAPTLVPYLLSPIDTTTLITNYPIDLATTLTTYPTKLATLLITNLINLTIVLTTYLINLATLHTQPPY